MLSLPMLYPSYHPYESHLYYPFKLSTHFLSITTTRKLDSIHTVASTYIYRIGLCCTTAAMLYSFCYFSCSIEWDGIRMSLECKCRNKSTPHFSHIKVCQESDSSIPSINLTRRIKFVTLQCESSHVTFVLRTKQVLALCKHFIYNQTLSTSHRKCFQKVIENILINSLYVQAPILHHPYAWFV